MVPKKIKLKKLLLLLFIYLYIYRNLNNINLLEQDEHLWAQQNKILSVAKGRLISAKHQTPRQL
jgi:hypothetical protein